MRRGVSSLILLLFAVPALADVNFQTGNDLFDLDRGSIISANSPVSGSVPEALISTTVAGGVEPGTMFFQDGSDGTVHTIEWQTSTLVTLGGFNVWANGDTPSFPERRTFDHFKLQAKVGQIFVTVYDEDVDVPYSVDGDDFLAVSASIDPVTSSEFRAEFTQHGGGAGSGPRIQEIDGFPPKLCGDANYNEEITTTDALLALRTAVGTGNCVRCVCNVNNMQGINTTDALLILRGSVGQPVDYDCFTCVVGEQ